MRLPAPAPTHPTTNSPFFCVGVWRAKRLQQGSGVAAVPASGSSCCAHQCLNLMTPSSLPPAHFHIYRSKENSLVSLHSWTASLSATPLSVTGKTKTTWPSQGDRERGTKQNYRKRYKNQSTWALNGKLKSKLVVEVNEVDLKKVLTLWTVHRIDWSGDWTNSKSMHIAHLPPCFKGLMQLKGKKKKS